MATLHIDVISGFALQANTDRVLFIHRRKPDGSTLRIDAEVEVRVLDASGKKVDGFTGYGQDVGMSFTFLTTQFFDDMWDAYKISKGYAESA